MSAAKMKHAFSDVTADGLLAAIDALTSIPRLDDDAQPQMQVMTLGRHAETHDWVVVMGSAKAWDNGVGRKDPDRRTFSSPELSHALYSALVDHWIAFDHFKEVTGWTPTPQRQLKPKVKKLVKCQAGRDGDCSHPGCPQLRDDEPRSTGRHCPLDK